nr:transposase [uncultured Brumimicrobium sp.]
MRNKTRTFSASFKAKVVVEAIKEQSTMQELASKYNLDGKQISKWKAEFLSNASSVFEKENEKKELEENSDTLHKTIDELKVENDFLKKVLGK